MKDENKNKKYRIPKFSGRLCKMNIVYIGSMATMFAVMGLVLIFIPKNDSGEKNNQVYHPGLVTSPGGKYSETVDKWFSDSVPDRSINSSAGLTSPQDPPEPPIEENSRDIPQDPPESQGGSSSKSSQNNSTSDVISSTGGSSKNNGSSGQNSSSVLNIEIKPVENPTPVSGEAQIINGMAIVGTRALMMYSGNSAVEKTYAEALNKYKEALPNVNVYCMVIPTACEFYSPPNVAEKCGSQREHINTVIKNLKGIQAVDAYTALANHSGEDIYLRTDHHWAPLGGYYAAQEFAKAAGVPFLPLSDYVKHVNTGYCGSMYSYTKSAVLKNNPEDFVYYVPQSVDWTTTYYNYKFSGGKIVGAYEPMKASFFLDYGNNSSDNFCTFMGGDAKIVHVETNTKNGRRLAIFKDSFANAVPGYLFGSFEEIYVLDARYFSHNAIDYLKEHNITDLLFANNAFVTANSTSVGQYNGIRTQADFGY